MEVRKKAGFEKKAIIFLIISAAVLVAVIIVFAMLFHRPSLYKPLHFNNSNEVSVYLTHELLPEFYNGVQLQEPFNLVVTQSGINDVVARFKWPQEFGGVGFSAPMVFFATDSLVLMGMVSLEGTELIGTIVAEPKLDSEGLMDLNVVSVKLGAMDVTPLAGVVAGKICRTRFAGKNLDKNSLWNKMIISLLNGRPFEPVFKVEDKKVRVEKITLEQKKLTVRLTPVFE